MRATGCSVQNRAFAALLGNSPAPLWPLILRGDWMAIRFLVLTGALALGAGAVLAQGLAGPRELPPAGFSGQQYVDSRGCMFMRAGVAGQTMWVPRVNRDRHQICGQVPSFTPSTDVAAAPASPAAPATQAAQGASATARAAGGPVAKPEAAPKPAAAAKPAKKARAAAPAAQSAPRAVPPRNLGDGRIACPASSPYLRQFPVQGGGATLLCSDAAGSTASIAAGWRPETGLTVAPMVPGTAAATGSRQAAKAAAPKAATPKAAAPAETPRVAAVPTAPQTWRRPGIYDPGRPVLLGGTRYNVTDLDRPIPPGYRAAWHDDRLNPRRGMGTVQGQIAQDSVWTREVPATLVAQAEAGNKVAISTSGPATAGFFVQIGSFSQPANAARSQQRLAVLGLPVLVGQGRISARDVQVVRVGPFASMEEARSALAVARQAGFGDAVIR